MQAHLAAERLAWMDTHVPPAPRPKARLLQPRTPGGTRPWDCLADDGAWYILKCVNNPQDRRQGPPLKVLTTELICARLGRLFDPPLCPEPTVIDVPPELAHAAVHPRTRRQPAERPAEGPGFGSRRVEGAIEIKVDGGARLNRVPLQRLARIIAFHTWLRGIDVSALVTDGGEILSIDHGYFLGGHRWDPARLAVPAPVRAKFPSQLGEPERLGDPSVFLPALAELQAIPEDRILAAFTGIPPEWGLPLEVRAQAAAWTLQRRTLVAEALTACPPRSGRPPRPARAPRPKA